ncbi:MAG: hypothetical protein E3J72_12960 [Planctomycetota bacterium]|nr:MAG: hypothetical protein E3J72_12960 [Planctomycetota bacterium]
MNWKIFIKYYNTTKKEFAFIVSIATIVIGLSVFIIYFILGRVEYRAGALLIAVFAGYVTGVIGFATQFWLFTPKNTAASMREHIVVGMILSLIQLTSIIIGTFAITFIATRF